jgi:hypothetical protein
MTMNGNHEFLKLPPWDCVVSGIDPGKDGRGISIFIQGKFEHSADDYSLIEIAFMDAIRRDLPLVFVMETHTRHGKWGTKQYRGIAEDVGVWKHYIKLISEKHGKKAHVKLVQVNVWRKAFFGHFKRPTYSGQNYWKMKAMEYTGDLDHNVAEAHIIGLFGTRWEKIGRIRGIKPIKQERQ